MLTFISLESLKKPQIFFIFSGGIKENIAQFHVASLNAISSIVKRNDCKNKTTWLTQITFSKSFSLFHNTYIEDINEFFKGLFFRLTLALY